MIIRLWSSYNTSVSSDGWSWVGTQSAERLFELPQLFVRSPVEQTGLCNYLPRTSSTFQGPGTPGDMVTFVGELVMLISTFKVIWSLKWGVRSTEKRNPSYILRNKRSQGESVTALRKVPRKQPTACQQHLLHQKDKPPALWSTPPFSYQSFPRCGEMK